MAKILFFFTSTYPFGTGETFIENEITYLEEAFDRIVIISNNIFDKQTRGISADIKLERKSYELDTTEKIKAITNIFNTSFKSELKIIEKVYNGKTTRPIFNTMVQSLQKIKVWSSYINKLIKKHCSSEDEIYLYSYWANDIALAISDFKHFQVKKRVCRAHRWDIYFNENITNYLPFRELLLSNIDEYHSISNDGICYLQKLLNKDFLSIRLSRLGVDVISGQNKSTPICLHVISVCNLIPVKNIKLLIDALSRLTINYSWTHIGTGPLKNELKEYAELKISGSYNFIGAKKNKEVKAYLASEPISLFVNVSKSEGVPVSIMEAMSYGIPCLATDVGGNSEIVNNSNGILLPASISAEHLAEKIKWFYNLAPEEKIKMRESAYNTWKNNFNAEVNYKAFANLILRTNTHS